MKTRFYLFVLLLIFSGNSLAQPGFFNFSRQVFGDPCTLTLQVESVNLVTGVAIIGGSDTQCPTIPFTWIWGDNVTTSGFFPQSHIYFDLSRNYVVKVISHYNSTEMDSAEIVVRFVPPVISPILLDTALAVSIPDHSMTFATRLYPVPVNMSYFDNRFFTMVPRSSIEYVLSIGSFIQSDLANHNTYLFNNEFQQYVMRDSTFGGAYSLWFTDPVSFCSGDYFFAGTIGYSSLFHEMGHNVTLNSPACYYYGGKIDGCANEIFSETMAQIYQHATGYELVNHYQDYGLDYDLMTDIRLNLVSTMNVVRNAYEAYVNTGKNYASWNDPVTPSDETFNTFMTIAYKFFEMAETSSLGYSESLKRMMMVLDNFNPDWLSAYDPVHNSSSGATFRSTLMVSALSYAFDTDLREEFRALNFPVNDSIYGAIYNSVTGIRTADDIGEINLIPNPATDVVTLQTPASPDQSLILEFYNMTGRLLMTKKTRNSERISLDRKTLPPGMLIVKVFAGNRQILKKLMIQ
jgi:hypothetical protein